MNAFVKWSAGVIAFLMMVGIFSRLVTFSGTPKTIQAATKAVANLFNGAFS